MGCRIARGESCNSASVRRRQIHTAVVAFVAGLPPTGMTTSAKN